MDFKEINAFLYLARMKNFSKAARAIGISQPTLSKMVARMEQELDVTLFKRTSGSPNVELTPAGEFALDSMVQLQDVWLRLRYNIKNSSIPEDYHIIASPYALMASSLTDALNATCIERGIRKRFKVKEMSLPESFALMEQDRTAMVFAPRTSFFCQWDRSSVEVGSVPAIAMIHKDNGLAARTELSLKDISESLVFLQLFSDDQVETASMTCLYDAMDAQGLSTKNRLLSGNVTLASAFDESVGLIAPQTYREYYRSLLPDSCAVAVDGNEFSFMMALFYADTIGQECTVSAQEWLKQQVKG